MPRYLATKASLSSETQPRSRCTTARQAITAEAFCSGGYLATSRANAFRPASETGIGGTPGVEAVASGVPAGVPGAAPPGVAGAALPGIVGCEGWLMRTPARFLGSSQVEANAAPGGRARRSSVDLSKDDVHRADHRDRVGDHVATRHLVEGREVREARRADLQAVRLVGAVAHDVDAELALRVLDRGVGL